MKLIKQVSSLKLVILVMIPQLLNAQVFENVAHRGGAGLLPENSIPAFLNAMDSSATTLEMEVFISKDGQVVVSHDPYISSDFCIREDGSEIAKSEENDLRIYQMNYEEIRRFDCGTKKREDFPDVERVPVSKPLLNEVIKETERYLKSYTQYEVNYLIEIRSSKGVDGVENPPPEEFSDRVYSLVDAYLPLSRVIIQSNDFRILKYWHQKYPEVKLSVVVEDNKSDDAVLRNLGFNPAFYAPYFKLIKKRTIRNLHSKGILVLPWTINHEKDMEKMMKWDVDGIITDYPNILSGLIRKSTAN